VEKVYEQRVTPIQDEVAQLRCKLMELITSVQEVVSTNFLLFRLTKTGLHKSQVPGCLGN
jgi:hypothetical protein